MKTNRLPFALVLFSPFACAQDGAHPTQPTNAQDPAYAAFKPFVGTWNLEIKMSMPGQPASVGGTETYEWLCNGQFLKSVVHSTFMGKPFHGVSLWSYDAKNKNYVNVWTDSENPVAVTSTNTYDSATKTWTSKTVSGHGPTRGVMVWKDDNTVVETSYTNGPDGKETTMMEITRKRSKPGNKPVTDAAATPLTDTKAPETTVKAQPVNAAAISDGLKELHRSVGKWTLTQKMIGPDGSAQETQGTETNSAACNGLWVWSDFQSTMMGQPFEGHGLIGYDPATKTFTNYWVDSMSPYVTTLTGTHDAKTKAMNCTGKSIDTNGKEAPMSATTTWTGEHARVSNFTFGSGAEAMKMEITYTRSQEIPSHKIK